MQRTGHVSKNLSSTAVLVSTTIVAILVLSLGSYAVGDVWIRTLCLGLAAAGLAVPLGLAIHWAIGHGGRTGRLLTVACLVSTMLPMVIHVSGWDAAIGKLGWLTTARGNVLTPLLSGWWAAVWTHGVIAAPQVGLILHFCDNKQQRVYEEQALLDADALTLFFSVSLWRLWPMLMVSVLWVIVTCSREITVVDLYQVETFAEQIYLGYSLGIGNTALAIAAVVMFIVLADTRRAIENDISSTVQRPNRFASWTGGILLLLLVAVPAANILIRSSFYVDNVDGQLTQNYSLEQVFRVLQKSWLDYRWELLWSLAISITSATLAIISSVLLARLTTGSTVKRLFFAAVVACGLALPGPVSGSVLAQAFAVPNWPWFVWLVNYTIFPPVIAEFLAHSHCWKFENDCWLLAIGLRTMLW